MKSKRANFEGDLEINAADIITALKKIWVARELVFKATVTFFIIGFIVALSSPVIYTSQTTFVPQVSGDEISVSNNSLGSLASLAGININPTEVKSDSYLSPLLYSILAESEEFSLDIIKEETINFNGEKLTIKEYLLLNKSSFNFNPIEFIKKYTIELFINNKLVDNNLDINEDYNLISDEDFGLINLFKNKFTVEINKKNGYIKVIAKDKNALVSAQLAEKVTKNLQSKIIEIRTNKIKERLEYSEEQYKLKQEEFDYLQKKLAEFKDSNKTISTARFMSELQKLESEYQLQQNILVNLASEYNKNKIKLNKDTPIFSVLDEVSVPNLRSKPNRSLIVIISLFIGLTISIIYILGKETLINLFKEINN